MTNSNNDSFKFTSKEAAIALLLDARKGHEAISAELAQHEQYMSDLCKAMLETYGVTDEVTNKRSLQLDLGDGSPRGHIVVQRGPLFFVRERNSGRPVGSKNKTKAQTVATAPESQPEVVVEEPSVVTEETTDAVSETSTLSPMEQALAIAEAELAEQAANTSVDPVADAIVNVATQAIDALKEHASRSIAPAAASAE